MGIEAVGGADAAGGRPMARAVRWKTGSGMPLKAPACSARPSVSAIVSVARALGLGDAQQGLRQAQSHQVPALLASSDIKPRG